jgi:hypothetical protein
MRGVVVDCAAAMPANRVQKHLKGGTVENVFAGMNFIGQIHTSLFIGIQNRTPPPTEFGKGLVDQACGALRPRV